MTQIFSEHSLPSMLGQFRVRYPMGNLLTELVTVHDGQYVVRASVVMGGTVWATGMAAATQVEAAEDRAKIRAIATLDVSPIGNHTTNRSETPTATADSCIYGPGSDPGGMSPPSALVTQSNVSSIPKNVFSAGQLSAEQPNAGQPGSDFSDASESLSTQPPSNASSSSTASSSTPSPVTSTSDGISDPPASPVASPPTDAPVVADWYAHVTTSSAADPDPESSSPQPLPEGLVPASTLASPTPAMVPPTTPPADTKSPPSPPPATTPVPSTTALETRSPSDTSSNFDLSEVIAQIDVEMKRVGWTKRQGREYLKSTYGKATRPELDTDELFDFLHYLQAQPAKGAS